METMEFEPQQGETWTATLQERNDKDDTWKIEGTHNGTLKVYLNNDGGWSGHEWSGSEDSLQPVLDGFEGYYE